jgi:hypothetical protein
VSCESKKLQVAFPGGLRADLPCKVGISPRL